jgi:hypothetical protein
MIGMKVRNKNGRNGVAIDAKPVHGDKRGRPAIDQRVDVFPHQMEASIEPAAGTEGVAAADELQMHSKVSAERGK